MSAAVVKQTMTPLCCAAAYVNLEVPGWLTMSGPEPRAGLSLREKPATSSLTAESQLPRNGRRPGGRPKYSDSYAPLLAEHIIASWKHSPVTVFSRNMASGSWLSDMHTKLLACCVLVILIPIIVSSDIKHVYRCCLSFPYNAIR